MKVAITGHTGGLGTELIKQYTEKNYQVVGFSKSNGFNLNSSVLFKQVVEQAAECDIVINNADALTQALTQHFLYFFVFIQQCGYKFFHRRGRVI